MPPNQIERRADAETRDRIEQLTVALERLVTVTENQNKLIDQHTVWINDHNERYHSLVNDLTTTKHVIGQWSKEIEKLNVTIENLVDIVSRFKGGWITLTIIGSSSLAIASFVLTVLKLTHTI